MGLAYFSPLQKSYEQYEIFTVYGNKDHRLQNDTRQNNLQSSNPGRLHFELSKGHWQGGYGCGCGEAYPS
jgi:hypothetical protein